MKITDYGVTHYYATCRQCNFDVGFLTDETPTRAEVRKAVKKHVKETGHTVVIESCKETVYGEEE